MVLILSESDVREAITMADGIRIVEGAIRDHAAGRTTLLPRVSLAVPEQAGMFRIMAASLTHGGSFGLKTLTGYPGRRLPGETYFTVLLFEATTGALRAVMAGNWLTGVRTGAATGVAAKYLSRSDARILGVIGAGVQARFQIAALMAVRDLEQVKIFSRDRARAVVLAREVEQEYGVPATAVEQPRLAVDGADLVVLATTASEPILRGEWLQPGMHVSGVGANAPFKRELDEPTFARSKVVVDFAEQVLQEAGDLQQAIRSGAIRAEDIHAELGDIVTGRKTGRTSEAEVTLFKSVGVAIEDIATASFVYEQSLALGLGTQIQLDDVASADLVATVDRK